MCVSVKGQSGGSGCGKPGQDKKVYSAVVMVCFLLYYCKHLDSPPSGGGVKAYYFSNSLRRLSVLDKRMGLLCWKEVAASLIPQRLPLLLLSCVATNTMRQASFVWK